MKGNISTITIVILIFLLAGSLILLVKNTTPEEQPEIKATIIKNKSVSVEEAQKIIDKKDEHNRAEREYYEQKERWLNLKK